MGWHHKEIILVNTNGYWNEMIEMINKVIAVNFALEGCIELFKVVNTPEEAFEHIAKL